MDVSSEAAKAAAQYRLTLSKATNAALNKVWAIIDGDRHGVEELGIKTFQTNSKVAQELIDHDKSDLAKLLNEDGGNSEWDARRSDYWDLQGIAVELGRLLKMSEGVCKARHYDVAGGSATDADESEKS